MKPTAFLNKARLFVAWAAASPFLSYAPGTRTLITVIVYSKGRNLDYSGAGELASASGSRRLFSR